MRYAVTIKADPHPSLWAECYLFAGLAALVESREITLQITHACRHDSPPMAVATVCDIRTGEEKHLAFDHYDRADVFNLARLAECDLYFKRSYYSPAILQACGAMHEKVRPYGLPFPCQIARSKTLVLRARIQSIIGQLMASPREQLRHLRDDLQVLHQFLASPRLDQFQQSPDAPRDSAVLFQTRLWQPDDTTDDADAVNNERVSIVRALKQAFGPRFRGGVIPTPYARAHFPDAITEHECNRTRYVALAKRCLVAVYTPGLHQSIAYKLPEYLAASQCIVSPDLRNQLPVPLAAGDNYLAFESADECVRHCASLLDDPDRSRAMSHANHQYFIEHVHPASVIRRCLDDAFVPASSTADSCAASLAAS